MCTLRLRAWSHRPQRLCEFLTKNIFVIGRTAKLPNIYYIFACLLKKSYTTFVVIHCCLPIVVKCTIIDCEAEFFGLFVTYYLGSVNRDTAAKHTLEAVFTSVVIELAAIVRLDT